MTSPTSNSLTLAIVTYGKHSSIFEKCLFSLQEELWENDRVIIIHEGKEDQFQKLLEMASAYQLTFECFSLVGSKGLSSGRNLAIEKCETEWIAFIDDDAEMMDGWRESFRRGVVEFPKSTGFTGPLYPIYEEGSREFPNEMEWIVSCNSFGGNADKVVRNGYGANMVFNARTCKEHGLLFDPSFGAVGGTEGSALAGEEAIFSIKLCDKSDNQIIWLHDMAVGHHVPKSRTTLSYVIHRSIKEGRTKSLMRHSKISPDSKQSSLSKELPHLFRTIFLGLPYQFIRIPLRPFSSVWNLLGIILMISGTAIGYLFPENHKIT